jgi:hypothetical protein
MRVSAYPRERLEWAARGSRSMSEALVKLGVDPRGPTRQYLLRRMRKLGVDTSHFRREGVKWTREVLREAVADSSSVAEVLRRLGLDGVGGHHAYISRRIKTYGIDVSHFRTPSPRGRTVRPGTPEALLVRHPERSRRVPGDRLRRALTAAGVPERCALCGAGPVWRGRPLPLEVDHISGDWRDNRPENLRLLCPNCHSTTDRWRGRARSGERRSR